MGDNAESVQARPMEVGVVVSDLECQVTFYRDALGCTEERRVELPHALAEEMGIASSGPVTLVVMRAPGGEGIKLLSTHQASTRRQRPETFTDHAGVAYLTFGVDDLQRTVSRLLAAGATLRSRTARVQVGPEVAVVFVDDPDGNTIELVERGYAR